MAANGELQEHDWLLSLLIPITTGELLRLERNQRVVFRKVDPQDASQVRGSGVFCGRCQLPWEKMTDVERERCRGEVPS
ncbi:MAG TPA: hypothetical protein VGN13_05600 [Solirubrobacteraceae bacterium]|jgi:hypothetical protein